MPFRHKYKGVWVNTITPFDYDNKILKSTLLKHYDFLQGGGVDGIIPLSPIGESPSLTFDEKVRVLRKYGEEGGNMLIMPAIIENSQETAKYFAKVAISAGVDGLVLFPPSFYRNVRQKSLHAYYEGIMEVIDKDDTHTPVFIACNDHYSGVPVSNYVLSALTERFENLYGIIDYGTNSEITNGVLDGCSDLVVLSANEAKYTSMPEEVGVEGIVSTIGNAFPSLVSSLYDIVHGVFERKREEKNMDKLVLLQQKIVLIEDILKKYPLQSAIKYALYQQQFPSMKTRVPLDELREDQKTVLKNEIKSAMGSVKAFCE